MPLPPTLPPDDPIKPYIEVRERFERRIDRDFYEDRPDNRSDLFSRWRIGANVSLPERWRAEVQYQYAHDLAWTDRRNFSTENSDIAVAYVEGPTGDGTITLGRQKIALGDQRLIGPLEWGNVGRTFDGVRFRGRGVDVWAAKIGVSAPRARDVVLAAAGHQWRQGTTTLIYKADDTPTGSTDIYTLNHIVKRKIGEVSLEFEGALQGGQSAGKDHEAWALHLGASKLLSKDLVAFAEIDAASGGSNPNKSLTFDQLYPTNHNKYGIADMQGWRNMNELAVGVLWRPRSNVSVQAAYRDFSLRDPADAWYGAGGAPNRGAFGVFRDPTGSSGRSTAREIDLDSSWTINPQTALQAGLAIVDPGGFVKAMNGGKADRQIWGYLQISTRF